MLYIYLLYFTEINAFFCTTLELCSQQADIAFNSQFSVLFVSMGLLFDHIA